MENRKVLLFTENLSSGSLKQTLEKHHWLVYETTDLVQAKDLSNRQQFNVGISILDHCNDMFFLEQLEELICNDDKTFWIIILPQEYECSFEKAPLEYKLINEYCFDFHRLPIQLDRLLIVLGHAYGMAEIAKKPIELSNEYYSRYGLICESDCMIALLKKIDKVAKENLSVLIVGETGTGKELIAKAIHNNSMRADQPFIAVNCGTLPESLVQAELFGHEKGAFTGAHKSKVGRIEAAQGGTLFLDEIGDLPLMQQVNLLRFLEEKSILRVGGEKHIPIDVRIIAATNVDLTQAIKKGEFREDLFFRLRELELESPPLRDRIEDIEILARYFFRKFSYGKKTKVKGFSQGALNVISHYSWPGNVRELANTIQRAMVMSENRLLSPADLGLEQRIIHRKIIGTLEQSRAEADRVSILRSLHYSDFNVTKAAKLLDISRTTLHRLIEKYKINVKKGRN